MSSSRSIAKRESLEAIISHRNQALELVEKGFETLRLADEQYRLATLKKNSLGLFSGFDRLGWSAFDSGSDRTNSDRRIEKLLNQCRVNLDSDTWKYIVGSTGIANLMDETQCSLLREQLRTNPPHIDLKTVTATLESLYENRYETFNRSVVNIFSRLCNHYKSNSVFSVGRRMIMTNCTYWMGQLDCSARDRLSDLDRILFMVQGLKYPGKDKDAGAEVYMACQEERSTTDSRFLHVKIFQNGNLHIYIRDKQLINRINSIIAEHYGQTLPTAQRHHYRNY